MARPLKRTVDYFPHFVNSGKTLLILQNEFGNDGYAFWFKLLSLLCKTDGQVFDYNNSASWRLLLAETCLGEDNAYKILQLLAEIEAIDPILYQAKIIWVQNLVDNLSDVYIRRRNGSVPEKPVIAGNYCLNCGSKLIGKRKGTTYCSDTCRQRGHRVTLIRDTENGLMLTETEILSTETQPNPLIANRNPVNVNNKPHTKLDYTKLKETKLKEIPKMPYGEFNNVFLTEEEYRKLIARFEIQGTKDRIEDLSQGIESHGYKYKSHYATILTWERKAQKESFNGSTRFTTGGKRPVREPGQGAGRAATGEEIAASIGVPLQGKHPDADYLADQTPQLTGEAQG